MARSRNRIEDRLAALEARGAPTSALGLDDVDALLAAFYAQGLSRKEAIGRLLDRDPSLLGRNVIGIAAGSVYDIPNIIFPGRAWGPRSEDPFVRLVSRLDLEHGFAVAVPGSDRHFVPLGEAAAWRDWDPIWTYFLAQLAQDESCWTDYWSLPRGARTSYGLPGYYLGRAMIHTKLALKKTADELKDEFRVEIMNRIDWILEQEEDPEQLPWKRPVLKEGVA